MKKKNWIFYRLAEVRTAWEDGALICAATWLACRIPKDRIEWSFLETRRTSTKIYSN